MMLFHFCYYYYYYFLVFNFVDHLVLSCVCMYVDLANSLYHCLNYGFMRNKESWILTIGNYFDFERTWWRLLRTWWRLLRTWWRLFQIRVVGTTFVLRRVLLSKMWASIKTKTGCNLYSKARYTRCKFCIQVFIQVSWIQVFW